MYVNHSWAKPAFKYYAQCHSSHQLCLWHYHPWVILLVKIMRKVHICWFLILTLSSLLTLMLNHLSDQDKWNSYILTHVSRQVSSDKLLSCVQLFAIPWTTALQASLSIINSLSLLKLMSIESVMPCNHPIFCHPLHLLPSIFPRIRVFSSDSLLCIRWPKYWSFSFNTNLPNEYWGLISFRMDCFDLLAVQGNLKSLLQHHNSKISILQCSAFFLVQLPRQYMTSGKTKALTRWTFVGKVTSLLFNLLSR